ncbi:MAG TPA: cation:proton antiporter [Actinomycetota bacterium]|nr:cation:proton antiporter [Actinomycetota bacterium]
MDGLAILAAVFVVYALVASRLDRWSITAPMVFALAGFLLGPSVLNVLPFRIGDEVALTGTEITLALLLFADASTVRLRDVEGDVRLPTRLLLIGLPLTIAAGTLVARLLFAGDGWASAAVIATILAPTDAALGLAVFTNPAVPVRIRRALNVESGLNDGLVTPVLTLFLALLASEEGVAPASWLLHATEQIAFAVVAAIVVGGLGGSAFAAARRRGWTSHVSEQVAILALALLAYGGAIAIDGNGFVAAFAAGLLFGATTGGRTEARTHAAVEFTETLGLFLSFGVWAIFGALLAGPVLTGHLEAAPIAYAVLSLTVVRIVPVALAWAGLGLQPQTVAFAGWFGPRGLASVVFTILAIQTLHEHGVAADTIVQVATWTIALSVLAHGLSAGPLSRRYGERIARTAGPAPELLDAPEPRIRRRSLGHRPAPA